MSSKSANSLSLGSDYEGTICVKTFKTAKGTSVPSCQGTFFRYKPVPFCAI